MIIRANQCFQRRNQCPHGVVLCNFCYFLPFVPSLLSGNPGSAFELKVLVDSIVALVRFMSVIRYW